MIVLTGSLYLAQLFEEVIINQDQVYIGPNLLPKWNLKNTNSNYLSNHGTY